MKISILSDQGDFSKKFSKCLESNGNVEYVHISMNLDELYQQLAVNKIVDVCIVEAPSLCHDEVMRIGNILQHFIPGAEIIFLSEYILPFTKRTIKDKNWTYYERSEKVELLVGRIVKNHKESKYSLDIVKERMTASEIKVLQFISTGMRQADVAEIMNLSPRTVNNHLANIYYKLGVNSSIAAVVQGIKKGIISV